MPSSAAGEHTAMPLQGIIRQRHIFIANYLVRAASEFPMQNITPPSFPYGLY